MLGGGPKGCKSHDNVLRALRVLITENQFFFGQSRSLNALRRWYSKLDSFNLYIESLLGANLLHEILKIILFAICLLPIRAGSND